MVDIKDTHTSAAPATPNRWCLPGHPILRQRQGFPGAHYPTTQSTHQFVMTTEGIGLVVGSSYSAPRCCGHWGRGKHAKHKAPFLAAADLLHSRLRAGCAVLHTARPALLQAKQASTGTRAGLQGRASDRRLRLDSVSSSSLSRVSCLSENQPPSCRCGPIAPLIVVSETRLASGCGPLIFLVHPISHHPLFTLPLFFPFLPPPQLPAPLPRSDIIQRRPFISQPILFRPPLAAPTNNRTGQQETNPLRYYDHY